MPAQKSWQYSVGGDSPAFLFWLIKFDPASKAISGTYLCQSLINLECNLSVGGTVGELAATFGDQDNLFFATIPDQPRAMDAVQLQLRNRHGQWAPAWTGLIDTVSRSVQPGQGNTVTIKATSPIKKFEITAQKPGDVGGIALSSINGLKGTAILGWASQKSECNYPGELAQIPAAVGLSYSLGTVLDLNADSGAQNWGSFSSSVFVNPTQQLWSAVIAAVQADSGVEWFADEGGRMLWRRPGFLNVGPQTPRRVLEEDVIHHTISEGDAGIVTRLEVRFGSVPLVNNATVTGTVNSNSPGPGVWVAPTEMVQHLGYRNRVIYAPWIRNGAAAQSLATFLGEIYSANTITGSVTIPADPYFNVGSVIEVPTLRIAPDNQGAPETAYFYISSVLYQLDWGNSWTMTLGLTYGRSKTDGFPYLKNFKWPVLSAKQKADKNNGLASGTVIQGNVGTDPNNAGKLPSLFTYAATNALTAGSSTAITDPSIIPWGTDFYVLDTKGNTLLEVVAQDTTGTTKPTVTGYNILLPTPLPATSGYVTFVNPAAYSPNTTTGSSGGTTSQPTAQPTTTSGAPVVGGSSTNKGTFTTFPLTNYTMRTARIYQEWGQTNYPGALSVPYFGSKITGYLEYPYTEPDGTRHVNFHTGMDFAPPANVAQNTPICCAVGGKIIWVGPQGTYPLFYDASSRDTLGDNAVQTVGQQSYVPLWIGNAVAVLTSSNLITIYGHLQDGSIPSNVSTGNTISEGQPIGVMGATGYAGGVVHLHFSIFDLTYQGWVDPRRFLPTGA